MICFGVSLSEFNLVWNSLWFLNLNICFLLQVWEVFSYNFIKISTVFFLSLLLGALYNVNVSMLIVPEVAYKLLSFLKICFPFCSFDWMTSIILSSRMLMLCFVSPNMMLMSSSVFFISVFVCFSLISSFYIFYLFVKVLSEFIHFSLEFGEHLYALTFYLVNCLLCIV